MALTCAVGHAAAAQNASAPGTVRTLLGDVAIILRTDRPGTLRIGVASESRSLTLAVRATDARRWADTAALLLSPKGRRTRATRLRPDSAMRFRASLDEPGIGAGTFVLIRTDSAGDRRYLLYANDAALDGVRQPLEPEEAALLVRLVRRAATPPKPRKRPSPGKGAAAAEATLSSPTGGGSPTPSRRSRPEAG